MVESDRCCVFGRRSFCERGLSFVVIPGPDVATPDCREEPQWSGFGTAIVRGDADEDIFGSGLGVFDENVEVAIAFKRAAVEKFEFRIDLRAAPIFLDEMPVGEWALRIFV